MPRSTQPVERPELPRDREFAADPIRAQIERSHQRILAVVGELTVAREPGAIAAIAGTLAEMLVEHFAEEEEPGGLFDEIMARHPVSEPRLAGLRQQHRELLGRVTWLRENAGCGRESVVLVGAERGELIELLRRHEKSENRLIVDAWYDDVGGQG
jgi:hypothetical protein